MKPRKTCSDLIWRKHSNHPQTAVLRLIIISIGVSLASPPSMGGVCSSGIFLQIWLMALCVTCVFAVTLSVFPVITVRVRTVYKDEVAWGQFLNASRDVWGRSFRCHLEPPPGGALQVTPPSGLSLNAFLFLPCRQSLHLRVLLHRLQRHGPGGPQRRVRRPAGECAAFAGHFLFLSLT